MTEERLTSERPAPDSELSVKAVLLAGLFLVLATALSAWLVWYLSIGLRNRLEAQDPPPPALPEARARYEPPSPRLQTQPGAELVEVRAAEELLLETYEWVQEDAVARVPIERGMELLLSTRPDARAFSTEGDSE